VVEHLHRSAPDLVRGEWLRRIPDRTRASIGSDGKSGACGQLLDNLSVC
jgi:hypothetical protein